MGLAEEHVRRLAEALSDPRTGFILGAGASAPEVPVMTELIRRVLRDFTSEITFFIPREDPEPAQFIFADSVPDKWGREMILSSSIETLRTLIARNLRPQQSALVKPPPQYELLAGASSRMLNINYNVDGLAGNHCPELHFKAVHGQIPVFVDRDRVKDTNFLFRSSPGDLLV